MRMFTTFILGLMVVGCLEDKLSVGQEGHPCRKTGDESKKCNAGLACNPKNNTCCRPGPGKDCPCFTDENCDTGMACNRDNNTCCRPGQDCPCWQHEHCDDGIECTSDNCLSGQCRHDDLCMDDGDPCNGSESCNLTSGKCQSSGHPVPPAPLPLEPADGAYTGAELRPQFRWAWQSPCGAAKFTFQLMKRDSAHCPNSSRCDFSSPVVSVNDLSAVTYRPANDLSISNTPPVGELYFWRVRACWADKNETCSDWSPARHLRVGRQSCDFNGDGYADVLVGAPDYEKPHYPLVGVWYGSENGLIIDPRDPAKPPLVLEPIADDSNPDINHRYGEAVACGGDMNGDGFGEAIVGQPGISNVFVYTGSAAGLARDRFIKITPTDRPVAFFGTSLDRAGDMNGDDRDEIIIGAPGRPDANQPPLVAVLSLASETEFRLFYIANAEKEPDNNGFGKTVAFLGDMDGDGLPEMAVGAPDAPIAMGQGTGSGKVFVYRINKEGDDFTVELKQTLHSGENDGQTFFGTAIAAGDATGDDYPDLIVGAPYFSWTQPGQFPSKGIVFVYRGPDFGIIDALSPRCDQAWFGHSLAFSSGANRRLAAGAPIINNDNCFGDSTGSVMLYRRGNLQNVTSLWLPVTQPVGDSPLFGWSVSWPGSIKGKPGSDLLVGAPGLDSVEQAICPDSRCRDEGRVFVFYQDDMQSPQQLSLPSDRGEQKFGANFGHSLGR